MIARLYFPAGTVEFTDDLEWVASDPSLEPIAEQARQAMASRSPADGYPGHAVATRLGREFGAQRVELCDLPATDEQLVY